MQFSAQRVQFSATKSAILCYKECSSLLQRVQFSATKSVVLCYKECSSLLLQGEIPSYENILKLLKIPALQILVLVASFIE